MFCSYMSMWRLLVELLVLLLVSTGKADECSKPFFSNSVVLTDEAILKNEFPDGSKVTIECATGYVVDHGSDTITCTSGTWSDPELICKKKDCGLPESLPYLKYNMSQGTLFGAYIQPFCETGYYLYGSSHRQCLKNGWSGKPQCKLITCTKPTEISNGMISKRPDVELPKMADIIEYSCDPGYKLIGNKSIVCQEDGDYSSAPPECIRIECQAPHVQFGVQVKGKSLYTHRSEAIFECQSGYEMEGSPRIICEEHGWSKLPVCIKESFRETSKILVTTTRTGPTSSTTSPDLMEKMPGSLPNATESADIVYTAAVLGTILSIAVVLAIAFVVHHHFKRKGSYNTGEALKTKEELLPKTSQSLTQI